MNVIKLTRKYPQFRQDEIFALQSDFNKLDVEDKGYLDEATAIKASQQSERKPYDVVRAALKEVELDSSRRVELEDFVDVRLSLPSHLARESRSDNSSSSFQNYDSPMHHNQEAPPVLLLRRDLEQAQMLPLLHHHQA